jgi:hypothetical protein
MQTGPSVEAEQRFPRYPNPWRTVVVLVRMRTDVRPYCNLHTGEVMTPAEVSLVVDNDKCSFHAYRCQRPDCGRLYDIINGYFEIIGGRIARLAEHRRLCPDDELPMYLAQAASVGGSPDAYECSQFGCRCGPKPDPGLGV